MYKISINVYDCQYYLIYLNYKAQYLLEKLIIL